MRAGLLLALWSTCLAVTADAQRADEPWRFILPEQRAIEVRDPSQLAPARIPAIPRPPTVTDPQFDYPPEELSLSQAINTGLTNLDVVRVLAGVTAVSSGRTVYDVAISNTRIDQERGAFDPRLNLNNGWNQSDTPNAGFDPTDPTRAVLGGNPVDGYAFDYGLNKRTLTGGVIDFGVNSNDSRFGSAFTPLNPLNRSAVDLSYTQPLWQGGGAAVNKVPIVLARIDTERSFFQYKDSIQNHVQGVIEAYWALVFARTDLWARQQQVEQLEFANQRTQARLEVGDANAGDAAQTRVAFENFRANLIVSQANVLQREAALRNILKLPPAQSNRLVPVSPLIDQKLDIDWDAIVRLAETQRPDIIELKLILEADQQRLLVSENQASARLDAVALYRWNGIEGQMPGGDILTSAGGQFADWNLGVNFSVPLGLRRERAQLRQQEMIIARDRVNLEQGLHQTVHLLALNLRNLEQFYEQYKRFQAVREAAKINLDQQVAQYNEGLIQFIVVLQAIVDWGNSVSSEAQSLVQYNTELARLELQTGTILEANGIAFYEERFGSIGPLGRFSNQVEAYPSGTRATPSVGRYAAGDEPSEEFFDLSDPLEDREDPENRSMDDEENDSDPQTEAGADRDSRDGDSRDGGSQEESQQEKPSLPDPSDLPSPLELPKPGAFLRRLAPSEGPFALPGARPSPAAVPAAGVKSSARPIRDFLFRR